jgi:phosphoglycolate phosphatase
MKWPLLIFDLDGTLIDSATDIAVALNRTLRKYGKSEVPYDVVVEHIGEGLLRLLSDFFPEHASAPPEVYKQIYDGFLQTYEEEMFKNTQPFPGVMDFLRQYEGPVGIITNKNKDAAKKLVRHLGLDAIPWVGVFGGDTFPVKKPDPLPLIEMMKRAGRTASQTFMIGDGTPDMLGARNAEVRAIAAAFGYTKMDILSSYEPVAVFHRYNDLQNVILGLLHH